jgi:hypothetical protein
LNLRLENTAALEGLQEARTISTKYPGNEEYLETAMKKLTIGTPLSQ